MPRKVKLWGGLITKNACTKRVWYKPEDSKAPKALETLQLPGGFVDGIATCSFNDRVFKVPDFASVFIDESGNVWPDGTASAMILDEIAAFRKSPSAWVSVSDFTSGDFEEWRSLFDIAKLLGGKPFPG